MWALLHSHSCFIFTSPHNSKRIAATTNQIKSFTQHLTPSKSAMNSPQPSSTAGQADKSPALTPTPKFITTPPKAKGAAPSMTAVATLTTVAKSATSPHVDKGVLPASVTPTAFSLESAKKRKSTDESKEGGPEVQVVATTGGGS